MDCSLPGSSVCGIIPGKNTGVGCHFLLHGIFPTEGQNLCLLRWQVGSSPLSRQGKPKDKLVKNSEHCVGDLSSTYYTILEAGERGKHDSNQFRSVAQFCPILCNPMDCSTPGFPVNHQIWELAQTHVHRVGIANLQY